MVRRSRLTLLRLPGREATDHDGTTVMARAADTAAGAGVDSEEDAAADIGVVAVAAEVDTVVAAAVAATGVDVEAVAVGATRIHMTTGQIMRVTGVRKIKSSG